MNFDAMTFEELKELIKSIFGDELFPDDCFDSPERFMKALKDLEQPLGQQSEQQSEQQPEKLFPYANGVSYRCNVLKMQLIGAAIHYPCQKFTLRELCTFRGLPLKKSQDIVSKWNRRHYPYFTKLQKRTAQHENVYKLRKYAITSYLEYLKRFRHGLELNLQRPHTKKVEIHVRINRHGGKMGLTKSDLPEIKLTNKE